MSEVKRKVKQHFKPIETYQQFVVIEDGVQVFDPFRIDVSVEDDPLPLVDLATDVVDDSTENVSEETVAPFASVRILKRYYIR